MTEEKQNNAPDASPHFGDIPINPHGIAADDEPRPSASRPEKQQSGKRRENSRRIKQKQADRSSKKGCFLCLLTLLLLPVAVFPLYLAGSFYLLPMYIKGPLANRLTQRLNRPVTISEAEFSPFSFDLHIVGIAIGADRDRRDEAEPELCRIESIDTRMRPEHLLHKKLVFEDVRIEGMRADLIRYADGGYTRLAPKENEAATGSIDQLNILPPWLLVQGLLLTDSAVSFQDQLNDKRHLLQDIELTLPSAESRQNIIEPTLRAVADGSPVLIQGQRHIRVDGSSEIRLSLLLDDIDPQKYLAWIPGMSDSLHVSTDRTDAAFEVILQDRRHPGTGPSVSGTVNVSGLLLDFTDNRETADKRGVNFSAPKARLVVRANPLQGLYSVEELTFDQPRLVLSDNGGNTAPNGEQLLAELEKLLNPVAHNVAVAIRQLTINKGTITDNAKNGRQWNNLQLKLTDFQNTRAAALTEEKPKTSLSLSAEHGAARIKFQGAAAPDLSLSGKISLRNMDTSLLRPYLSPANTLYFSKGKVDLTGILRTEQINRTGTQHNRAKMLIERSAIKVRGFTLNRKNNRKETALLTGKSMYSRGCAIDIASHTVSCSELLLKQANFSSEAPAFFLPLNRTAKNKRKKADGKLNFSSNSVKIVNSTARLPLSHTEDGKKKGNHLLLSDLNITLTDLQAKKPSRNNLTLQATVDKDGIINAEGLLHKGSGSVLLTAENMEINLFQKAFAEFFTDEPAPALKQGCLQLKGILKIPENDFSGSFQLNNLIAENSKGTSVRWRQGGGKVIAELSPFSADIDEFTLHDFTLNRRNNRKEAALLTAEIMKSGGCAIDSRSHTVSCADLLLEQADFSAEAPAFFLPSAGNTKKANTSDGKLRFSSNSLKIVNSTVLLPLSSAEDAEEKENQLLLSDLNMHLTDLQAKRPSKNNLSLQATVGRSGKEGKINADGSFHKGIGSVLLTAEELDINLFNKPFTGLFKNELALSLRQGLLRLKGRINIPAYDFLGGFRLDNLLAANTQGTAVRWRQGIGGEVTAKLSPFSANIGELTLLDPVIEFASADDALPAALFSLLRTDDTIHGDKPVLPPFIVEQCLIRNGALSRKGETGDKPGFSEIEGMLAPMRPGTETFFDLSGKMDGGDFSTKGRIGSDSSEIDELAVEQMPLKNTGPELARQLQMDGTRGTVTWTGSPADPDTNKVDFAGFTPLPESDFSLLLALLTDTDGSFSLPLQSVPAAASETAISKAAAKELQRLRLQTVVSPYLVIEKFLPELTLPPRIDFIAGDTLPDFMDGLENFASLLKFRPHLGLSVRGCYDDEADRQHLLQSLLEDKNYTINLENIRREEEMARLTADEELRQTELIDAGLPVEQDYIPEIEQQEDLQPLPVKKMWEMELPEQVLPDLSRQRAEVVHDHLVNTLNLPADRITVSESAPGGTQVDLSLVPLW